VPEVEVGGGQHRPRLVHDQSRDRRELAKVVLTVGREFSVAKACAEY
jgi:hypothetical protein